MAKLVDLTNKRYGKLTILEKVPRPERKYKKPVKHRDTRAYWRCLCDCGNEVIKSSKIILRATSGASCGCDTSDLIAEKKVIDMTNERFGRLRVLSMEPLVQDKDYRKQSSWLCICDCGKETIVGSSLLRSGKTQSCGCLRSELTKERRTVPLPTNKTAHMRVKGIRGPAKNYSCVDCGTTAQQWAYNHKDPNELQEDSYVEGVYRVSSVYSGNAEYYDPKCVRCNNLDKYLFGQYSPYYEVKPKEIVS